MTAADGIPGQAGLPTSNSTKSFWHSEPSKILLGHRTTGKLPSSADVVIIGSGIAGTSAAHCLGEHKEGKDLNVGGERSLLGSDGMEDIANPLSTLHHPKLGLLKGETMRISNLSSRRIIFTGHGMPTARLSAKAVVGLMMEGEVENVDLPGRYVLSEERVEKARMLDVVNVADEMGHF